MTQTQLFTTDLKPTFDNARFNGSDYDAAKDQKRLSGQVERVYNCMSDARWRTLSEIASVTGDGEASISAQLRHLKKPRFGSHRLEKRRRGAETSGLWEYRLDGGTV